MALKMGRYLSGGGEGNFPLVAIAEAFPSRSCCPLYPLLKFLAKGPSTRAAREGEDESAAQLDHLSDYKLREGEL